MADTPEDLALFQHFFTMGGLDVDEADFNGCRTQLHNAAYNNCLKIAKFLLRKNADASIVAEKGYTPLHVAVSRGHDRMANVILQMSSAERVRKFIDAKTTNKGYTALHLAAKNNMYEAVRGLLSYGANFEIKDKRGKKPIELTTLEKVRRLLGSTSEMSRAAIEAKNYSLSDLNLRLMSLPYHEYMATSYARNRQGYTPLQVAIDSNHLPTVKVITEARCYRLTPGQPFPQWTTVKHFTEQIMLVWSKLKWHMGRLKNENSSRRDALRDGSYALFHAHKAVDAYRQYKKVLLDPIVEPHVDMIEEVLEVLQYDVTHFDVNYDEDDATFVSKGHKARYYKMLNSENEADRKSFIELVEMTIGVPLALLIRSVNSSSLLEAVKNNDLKAAEECTASSFLVDMDIRDKDERRPLHIAVAEGNESMVEFLLRNKADMLEATDEENETPLHVAVKKGHYEIVELLLYNCDVDKVNDYVNEKIKSTGSTALHFAATSGKLNIMGSLLEHHAIYCIRDKKGKTPSDLTSNDVIIKSLKFIAELFDDAKAGRTEIIEKLKRLERDVLLAVGNACDEKGYSVPQVASINKHRDIGRQVFQMVVEAKKSKEAEFK